MTTFRAVEKAILTKEQLAAFQSSKTYAKVTSYIEVLNNAVVGRKLTDECTQSEVRRVRLGLFHHAGFAHRSGILCVWIYIILFRESLR